MKPNVGGPDCAIRLGRLGGPLRLAAAWLVILATGVAGVELYTRYSQGYLLRRWHLAKSPFFELDRLKLWNRRFVEDRKAYFRDWPIPVEVFDAEKSTPRYLFKPNLRMKSEGNRLVPAGPGEEVYRSSNSWGLRGADVPRDKAPGGLRVVCLGASTTEGSQGDRETYPYFLEEELRRLLPGRTVEVINAGHHGQQIADLLEILRQRVLPLDPDIVIFYEAANDIGWREYLTDSPCGVGDCWLHSRPVWYR